MNCHPESKILLRRKAGKRTHFYTMALSNYYDEIDTIINSMSEYLGLSEDDYDDMSDFDDDSYIDEPCCTYSDIDTCSNILENYIGNLTTLSKDPDDGRIMALVEKTVRKLNKLNEKCEYELIDPVLGDDICEFIHNSAVEAGLEEHGENVADEWRDF